MYDKKWYILLALQPGAAAWAGSMIVLAYSVAQDTTIIATVARPLWRTVSVTPLNGALLVDVLGADGSTSPRSSQAMNVSVYAHSYEVSRLSPFSSYSHTITDSKVV
jgi:hypothetical protein